MPSAMTRHHTLQLFTEHLTRLTALGTASAGRTYTNAGHGLPQVGEVNIRLDERYAARFDQQQLERLVDAFPNMQKLSVSQG